MPVAVEPVPFIALPVGPGADASSGPVVFDPVPFVPAHNIKPQKTPAQAPANTPSDTAPPPHTRMPSHTNPRPAPTPAALSPLLRRRESTTRHHTRPHTLSSLTGTHTPPSGRTRLARTPARALPRPAAATPCYATHAALTAFHRPRCRCLDRASCHGGIVLHTPPSGRTRLARTLARALPWPATAKTRTPRSPASAGPCHDASSVPLSCLFRAVFVSRTSSSLQNVDCTNSSNIINSRRREKTLFF